MKKMKLTLAVLLIMSLLAGCLGSVGEVTVKEDGSGSATLSMGFTEDGLLLLEAYAEENGETLDMTGADEFTYNGVTYYGTTYSFGFEDLGELADTLNEYSVSNADMGLFTFSIDGDAIVMQITVANANDENADASGEEVDPELEAMMEQAAIVCDFNFYDNVTQTAGGTYDAIKVEGSRITIDYLALSEQIEANSEETFAFSVPNKGIPTHVSASFADVKPGDWFYDQVISMANGGLIVGRPSGLFCPQDPMTRAEFVAVAVRAVYGEAGENLLNGEASPWWDKHYQAAKNGIISEELFPYNTMEQNITREEMALIAYNLVLIHGSELATFDEDEIAAKIPDVDQVSEEYLEAVLYCYADGILQGMDASGKFAPGASMTRAQASTVMQRVLERVILG